MESHFSAPSLILLVIGMLTILFGPRRYVVPALLFFGLFIPLGNHIVIFSLNFMAHRLLVLAGMARLCLRGDGRGFEFQTIDKLIMALTAWSLFAYVTLWGTSEALVYQLGRAFDMIGLYFLFRVMLRSHEDWMRAIKALAVIAVVFAGFMLVEFATGRNMLAVLGGLDEEVWNRRGRLRCRATFGHAISAGVFGAALMPLWLVAWKREGAWHRWAIFGLAASTVMTITSASSSSVMTYGAGVFGFFMWHFRHRLRLLRWATVGLLVGLHIVMTAPVWALMGRLNVFGGSTGYYRYALVDNFIQTFDQWWLIGLKDPEEAFGMWDLCNLYVLEGIRGGLLRLVLFILLLVLCFRQIGRVLNLVQEDKEQSLLVWSLGAMLFAHTIAFLGYNYWDQVMVPWYLSLAMIAGLHQLVTVPQNEVLAETVDDDLGDSSEPGLSTTPI